MICPNLPCIIPHKRTRSDAPSPSFLSPFFPSFLSATALCLKRSFVPQMHLRTPVVGGIRYAESACPSISVSFLSFFLSLSFLVCGTVGGTLESPLSITYNPFLFFFPCFISSFGWLVSAEYLRLSLQNVFQPYPNISEAGGGVYRSDIPIRSSLFPSLPSAEDVDERNQTRPSHGRVGCFCPRYPVAGPDGRTPSRSRPG